MCATEGLSLQESVSVLYLGCVGGCDDPSAVGVVVVLHRVVWRRDDAAGSSQLTSTHRCCKMSHSRECSVKNMFVATVATSCVYSAFLRFRSKPRGT